MPTSTKKAVRIAWVAISSIAITSMALIVPIALLSDYHIAPKYVTIPLLIILPVATMGLLFHLVAIRWLIWAFKNVEDVKELEKAMHLSGFGAYSPNSLEKKHPTPFNEIRQRFDCYNFVDDMDVPSDVFIYNRKYYRSWHFILGSSVTLCLIIWFVCCPATSISLSAVILLCLTTGLTIHQYRNTSDTSPQITLNQNGIWQFDYFIGWNEVMDYQIIGGETSCLELILPEQKTKIDLDYLNISKLRLNHFLHVYQQRHKQANLH